MNAKTFQFIPADEKTILQAIKLIHYEFYYRSRVDDPIISDILWQDNVWIVSKENAEVCPL